MSDTPFNNPFQSLNKKKFSKKATGKPSVANMPSKEPKRETLPDDDDSLFLQAMTGVDNPLSNTHPKGQTPDSEMVSMNDLDAFKSVKKLRKKKGSSKLKPSHDECDARQRSRSAVENAPPKEKLDDEEAFLMAMQGVDPVSTKGGRDVSPEAELAKRQKGEDPVKALHDLIEGTIEFQFDYTDEYIQAHVTGLDPIFMGKLRAGQYSPEAHLDLHGMVAAEAYDALVLFMKQAYMKGKRTVLVIPGRGKNSPEGYGVLREKIQHWLTREPFKRVVLAYCTAQAKDGGAGAMYVMLRKYKKSRGAIQWDRNPYDADVY